MKRFSPIFLIFCWLAYFSVPLVNAVGQTGPQRIAICTTLGVETYFVFDDSTSDRDKASQHSSSHSCPCTHFFLDTATVPVSFFGGFKALAVISAPVTHYVPTQPQGVSARGPPSSLLFRDYLTPA
ncbi:hypothetical protein ACFQ45_01330 [Rhodanobacter aciditrophus]|uniref:DUF2946 domain-containing protein n=1 Tax=Rhodanobacter aciditrophus TaxID=1623218 RepID=A0ABW4AXG7_9GAMM